MRWVCIFVLCIGCSQEHRPEHHAQRIRNPPSTPAPRTPPRTPPRPARPAPSITIVEQRTLASAEWTAVSRDGHWIAALDRFGRIALVDATGVVHASASVAMEDDDWVWFAEVGDAELGLTPDGRYVVACLSDANREGEGLVRWDLESDEVDDLASEIYSCEFALAPDGRSIVHRSNDGYCVRSLDGTAECSLEFDAEEGYTIQSFAWTANSGAIIALLSHGDDNECRVVEFDARTGRRTNRARMAARCTRMFALSRNHRSIALYDGFTSPAVRLFDARTGGARGEIPLDPTGQHAVAFTHDGQWVMIATKGAATRYFDAATAAEVQPDEEARRSRGARAWTEGNAWRELDLAAVVPVGGRWPDIASFVPNPSGAGVLVGIHGGPVALFDRRAVRSVSCGLGDAPMEWDASGTYIVVDGEPGERLHCDPVSDRGPPPPHAIFDYGSEDFEAEEEARIHRRERDVSCPLVPSRWCIERTRRGPRVVDSATGRAMGTLRVEATDFRWSVDGARVAVGDATGISVFDIAHRRQLAHVAGEQALAIDERGRFVIETRTADGTHAVLVGADGTGALELGPVHHGIALARDRAAWVDQANMLHIQRLAPGPSPVAEGRPLTVRVGGDDVWLVGDRIVVHTDVSGAITVHDERGARLFDRVFDPDTGRRVRGRTHFVACVRNEAHAIDLARARDTTIGECRDSLTYSDDGRFSFEEDSGSVVATRTADGETLWVTVLGDTDENGELRRRPLHFLATTGDGRFEAAAADRALFAFRRPGPLRSAHIARADDPSVAHLARTGLVRAFFEGRPLP